ncbi:MAG: peptidase M24 [Thiotrichales bacterium]|nr:peptidase M24 [Thiotrichales bacterium]
MFEKRISELQTRMSEQQLDAALITDDDAIYYFTGYFDYLHMEFGRPTILVVRQRGESLLITPTIDYNTALDCAHVDRIVAWNDGTGTEWREHLPDVITGKMRVALEFNQMPPLVRAYVDELLGTGPVFDISPLIAGMRMIKSSEELQLARHAGAVATAMMQAGREAIGDGVAEYEVALAIASAGTRVAAQLLENHYPETTMSPNTHFLQIMASGDQITRTHHRASTRIMRKGEPVFLCFCGMTNFHRFKLGFDRTFWIENMADESQEAVYSVALESQAAALKALRPGAVAEDVHAAYAEVIQSAGHEYPFRCGRGTGFSFLEKPQLVTGDKTVLQPGMVLAVDGSVNTDSFRAQIGDSFIVTDDGYEAITAHPKSVQEVIVHRSPKP